MTRRLFEFTCSCSVFREAVELEVKGQKGRLRKIVLKEVFAEGVGAPQPTVEVPTKQATLNEYFARAKSATTKRATKALNEESAYVIQIFAGAEKLYDYHVKQIQQINKRFLAEGKVTLLLREAKSDQQLSILLSNSTMQTLNIFLDKITLIKTGKVPTQEKEQPQIIEQQQQQPLQQLNQLQLMKLKRKGVDVSKYEAKDNRVLKKVLPNSQEKPTTLVPATQSNHPKFLVRGILSYLPPKLLFNMRIISKLFNEEICMLLTSLSFKRHQEVPIEVFHRCLNKFKRIESLSLGRLKNITPKMIQDMTLPNFIVLKSMDLGAYYQLTDRVAELLLLKADRLQNIVLPYNSRISNQTINLLTQKMQGLEGFQLKTRGTDHNDLIQERVIAQLCATKRGKLVSVKLASTHVGFFDAVVKGYKQSEAQTQLEVFKAKHLFGESESISEFASMAPYLRTLTVSNLKGPKLYAAINNSLQHFQYLISLSLGEFCDDAMCLEISKRLPQLCKIKIASSQVNDSGIEQIFGSCMDLEDINFVGCNRLNGHCFESLKDNSENFTERKLRIKVQFDDYRAQMLSAVLQEKFIVHEIINKKL